jgi:hypothetical protein
MYDLIVLGSNPANQVDKKVCVIRLLRSDEIDCHLGPVCPEIVEQDEGHKQPIQNEHDFEKHPRLGCVRGILVRKVVT